LNPSGDTGGEGNVYSFTFTNESNWDITVNCPDASPSLFTLQALPNLASEPSTQTVTSTKSGIAYLWSISGIPYDARDMFVKVEQTGTGVRFRDSDDAMP
jgi:hypothetical protein